MGISYAFCAIYRDCLVFLVPFIRICILMKIINGHYIFLFVFLENKKLQKQSCIVHTTKFAIKLIDYGQFDLISPSLSYNRSDLVILTKLFFNQSTFIIHSIKLFLWAKDLLISIIHLNPSKTSLEYIQLGI